MKLMTGPSRLWPRRLRVTFACAAACLVSAACAQNPPRMPQDSPSSAAPGECHDDAAQFAVGQVLDATLGDELRRRCGAHRVRVLRPGQMSTMEFDAARLTIEVDAAGHVVAARCG